MSIEKVRGASPCPTAASDPRHRILKEHYFSIRPAPLEEWLWDQNLPPSAERVFWMHWREGHRRGDFCSEIPLSVVARRCRLNISSVTRAYQKLEQLGCLKRTNPGRNPANPFCQATALTELFIPKPLLAALPRYPRRATGPATEPRRAIPLANSREPQSAEPPLPQAPGSRAASSTPLRTTAPDNASAAPISKDPLAGLSGRQRMATLSRWREAMSETERCSFDTAFREHHPTMAFDETCRLPLEDRTHVLELLRYLAEHPPTRSKPTSPASSDKPVARKTLRAPQAAALRGKLATLRGLAATDELLRQIAWSIERGALNKYPVPKAMAIALKKVGEDAWSRPHRMPPNWWPVMPSTSYAERHN